MVGGRGTNTHNRPVTSVSWKGPGSAWFTPPRGDDNLFLKTQVEKCSHSCENTGGVSTPGLCSKALSVDGAGVEVQGRGARPGGNRT